MKKTPSALKWLAEKRARVAGDLKSAEQVCQQISEDIEGAQQELAALETLQASAGLRQQRISKELAALDQVVVLYDQGIKPELIEPINAWQGNYGKRGALREFLLETLERSAPDYVSTKELEILTISKFSLVFELRALQAVWYRDSFRDTLKVLARQKLIERGPDQAKGSHLLGKWRWKQAGAGTLVGLRDATD